MIFTGIFSIIETINVTFLNNSLYDALSNIPLYQEGVGWILPAIIGVIVGILVSKIQGKTSISN